MWTTTEIENNFKCNIIMLTYNFEMYLLTYFSSVSNCTHTVCQKIKIIPKIRLLKFKNILESRGQWQYNYGTKPFKIFDRSIFIFVLKLIYTTYSGDHSYITSFVLCPKLKLQESFLVSGASFRGGWIRGRPQRTSTVFRGEVVPNCRHLQT